MTTAIEVKSRPILFNSAMVQALLAGRKTQTRRKVQKWEEGLGQHYIIELISHPLWKVWCDGSQKKIMSKQRPLKSPYEPGMELWVRETHAYLDSDYHPAKEGRPVYRADHMTDSDGPDLITWKPSIFMPRAASRITITVTGVRVERLQDISEQDAIAEGIDYGLDFYSTVYRDYSSPDKWFFKAVDSYRTLWDSINGKKEGATWSDNPWVWVVEFELAKNPIEHTLI